MKKNTDVKVELSTSNYMKYKSTDAQGRTLYGWQSINKSIVGSAIQETNYHVNTAPVRTIAEHQADVPTNAQDVEQAPKPCCTVL